MNLSISSLPFYFAYDPIGNRISSDWTRTSYADHHWTYWGDSGATAAAGDELNQYRRINHQIDAGALTQAARLHDDDGNLLEDGGKRFLWDAENRMIAAYDNNGTNDYKGKIV